MSKQNRGFTLPELMIVVAIVGIVTSFAVPSYLKYVTKDHRNDAVWSLIEAANAQENIYAETNSYVTNDDLDRLVVNSDGVSSRYGFYQLSVSVSGCAGPPHHCFTITAVPQGRQLDDEDECSSFSINHLGQTTATGTEVDCFNTGSD